MATDGPVSDSIEEPSTVTNKVLRHSTISQDASSGGPLFAEKLAPLTQPLDRIQPNVRALSIEPFPLRCWT